MRSNYLRYPLSTCILIAVGVLGNMISVSWDVTDDRRYTLTDGTVALLEELDQRIFATVLLEGDMPAGFSRLQRAVEELLADFQQINGNLRYQFSDPQKGSVKERNERAQVLAQNGVIPTRLRIRDRGEAKEQLIYPYLILNYGDEQLPINLLENEQPGVDNEVVLNNSIALLEYKIADGIQKVLQSRRKNIVLVEGHGELRSEQTRFVERELRKFYNTARVNLDSVIGIPAEVDLVIIAKPRKAFSDKELFVLDQYIVNGGSTFFLLDPVAVSLDSLGVTGNFIPEALDLNLNPLLFKYGARVQPTLVLDLECTRIPLVVGQLGDRVQTELFPWYYHPVVVPEQGNAITRNIDRVNLQFPGSIDTIQTAAAIKKTALLRSSEYSRIQRPPVRLNLEILRYEAEVDKFNQPHQLLAVMLEGEQESAFANRVSSARQRQLASIGREFVAQRNPSKIVVVADGDVLRNRFSASTGEIEELGFNRYEHFVFNGNQAFVFNTIEYLLDESGVIEARSKEIKLRRLNMIKARAESVKWQTINVVAPLLMLFCAVWLFNWRRRKKYGFDR